MSKKCQGKRIKNDNKDLDELKIFFKVLTKRYVLGPILLMLLYLLDHPTQQLTKVIHEMLKGLIAP